MILKKDLVNINFVHRYSWVSHRLVEERSYQWFLHPKMQDLIPLESSEQCQDTTMQEKLVIGHSVGYDRSFVKEQYLIKVWEIS